jgi:putative acetyltransferase
MILTFDVGENTLITVRKESKNDFEIVKKINDEAFGQPQEGIVVDKLRTLDPNALSLVAEVDGKLVGHIFYSSAEIDHNKKKIVGMGLAPVAVLPEYQRQGIGKKLITESINMLLNKTIPFIIVLGHEEYYPKFGFEIASKYGIKCQWDNVPDEAFMIMIIDIEVMKNIRGVAKYRDEWNEAM